MKPRYIHVFVGVGDHVLGAFDGFLETVKVLVEKHSADWVDEQIEFLATGNSDGNIAWVTDVLGYCITTSSRGYD